MMPSKFKLLAVAAVFSLTGCVPATYTIVPEVRGRVVTAEGVPAGGAKVTIARADGSPKFRGVVVTGDARGAFHRNEQTQWTMVVLLPIHGIGPDFTATARHGGLESAPKRFSAGMFSPHHFGVTNKVKAIDLGDLVLQAER